MGKTITVNLKTNEYTNRVLGVVKEKYGLTDKGQALDKFAEIFGDEFVDREVKDEVIKEVIASCDAHIKKYGYKKTSLSELEKLFSGD